MPNQTGWSVNHLYNELHRQNLFAPPSITMPPGSSLDRTCGINNQTTQLEKAAAELKERG